MYQHGGDAWTPLERARSATRSSAASGSSGHQAGSWDPDESLYGTKGGRIYCTALATLTLEVYYRFLRLYDDPKIPSVSASTSAPARPAAVPSRRVAPPVPDRR